MDNEDENLANNQQQNEKKKINISPQTPIRVDEFTLADIFDSETIKMGVKALISLMEQSTENDKAKNEITKKQLDNQIELRRLDIKEQELDIKAEEQEQKHIKWFDIRNKVYSVGMLLLVLVATVILKYADILDKSEARAIVLLVFGLGMATNTDFIKNVFKKKDD